MCVISERQLTVVLGVLPAPRGPWSAATTVIWGHDTPGQGEQIIDRVARPLAREQLREAARSLGPRF